NVPTQPTCSLATGSVTLSGLPSGTWTINPGNITGNTATKELTGLTAGTYNFTVTNAVGCTSLPSADVVINAQPVTPAEPTISAITQPTCATATGSFTITNYDPAYTYTITPLTNVVQNRSTVTAPAGSYKVTATLGACTSVESVEAVINAQPGTPVRPLIRSTPATCLVTVSSTIDNYVTGNTYTFDPVGPTVDASGLISGMAIGTDYTVTSGDVNCTSVASASFSNAAQLATPEVPLLKVVVQPNCVNVIGSFSIENYDVQYKYDVIPSIGVTQTGNVVTAPSGSYTIIATLGSCSSVRSNDIVMNNVICANKDIPATINGKEGGNTAVSVLDNDTLNGKAVVRSEITLTPKGTYPTGITLNADGTIRVASGTPADNYEIEYKICEKLSITNCSSTKVTVVVEKPVIDAVTETTDLINGITGGTTPPLTSNDILNGDKVVIGTNPGDVILTPKSVPTGLMLNPDGTVTVAPNTPAGNYNVEYQICEVTNQGNCDTVTSVVAVGAAVIDAVDDNVIFADGINGALEIINVLDNDRLNGGKIINPAVVTLKSLTVLSGITLNVDGTVDVAPNTPGGVYTLTYQICDVINRSNCITAKVTIFVEVPSIAVVKTAVFNDENNSGYANAGETITYKFKIANTGNTPLLNVIIDDKLPGLVMSGGPITLGVNEVDENSFIGTYVIKQSDINLGKISNQATVFGTSANGITVEDESDNISEVDDNPTVSPIEGCVIKVFNAISPNGDSRNERFYIQGLECYPDNTVEIYNRWGVLVFERDSYNNEERAFKGFSEGRTTVQKSEGLPVGTYYYVLKYKDSESNAHQKAGYLYINK
ncbi:gliding motility-associated C-terminal domain-containing protein, partial [Flavobacterium sp. ALJ2]|uniref:gliding motility-associated C-terminal domain-containing protein n=1 Tax=Flavobacterium sp. ALJ2 TaxID=2786960 RepID=UPI00189D9CE9